MRRALEEGLSRDSQDAGNVLQAARPMWFMPFSYFCTCWKGKTKFICNIYLTQVQHEPTHAHPRRVYRLGSVILFIFIQVAGVQKSARFFRSKVNGFRLGISLAASWPCPD